MDKNFSAEKAWQREEGQNTSSPRPTKKGGTQYLDFADNHLVAALVGAHDSNLTLIEKALNVRIDPRGNRLAITGLKSARTSASQALQSLYDQLEKGEPVSVGDVRAAARLAQPGSEILTNRQAYTIKTPKRIISPRTDNQAHYLAALQENDLVFGTGPAGTGKTYLAMAHAVHLLLSGSVERLVLTRPAIEAGERIGFLPGDMKDKVDPYLRPLYDALYDMMDTDFVERRLAAGDIEIAPLGFMRGRTFARAAVILDEGQNATATQMKMFLTRLGEGASMVVTGDPGQSDLPAHETSGLNDALSILGNVKGVGHTKFVAKDVVRHPMVARIIRAYDRRDQKQKATPSKPTAPKE